MFRPGRVLPLALLEGLFGHVSAGLYSIASSTRLWLGHRTWLIDGSNFFTADRPELEAAFGQPGQQADGCGFPVAHLLSLFHAQSGFLQNVIPSPLRTHDMANAADMHDRMRQNDVLIADRGFASFAHLAVLFQRKVLHLPHIHPTHAKVSGN